MLKLRPIPRKPIKLAWQVIAVVKSGSSIGNCGHRHRTKNAAVSCRWAPPRWEEMLICDLLVRQVRIWPKGSRR